MTIGPALILAVLVGVFNTALFVLIRGSGGGQLPLLFVAAVLGAWAGDALGGAARHRRASIGDFHLVGAFVVSWIGIGLVSVVAILGPSRRRT